MPYYHSEYQHRVSKYQAHLMDGNRIVSIVKGRQIQEHHIMTGAVWDQKRRLGTFGTLQVVSIPE